MPVKTAEVEGRRKLDYASFEELLADADRLGSGPVKAIGNWSAGQVFKHLATVYNGSIDGIAMTLPWHIRVMAGLFKKRLLSGPMPAGIKLPTDGEKTLMPEPTSTEAGLADLPRGRRATRTGAASCPAPRVRHADQARVGPDPPQAREPSHEFPRADVLIQDGPPFDRRPPGR